MSKLTIQMCGNLNRRYDFESILMTKGLMTENQIKEIYKDSISKWKAKLIKKKMIFTPPKFKFIYKKPGEMYEMYRVMQDTAATALQDVLNNKSINEDKKSYEEINQLAEWTSKRYRRMYGKAD